MKKIGKQIYGIFLPLGIILFLYSCEYKEIADADYPQQKIYLTTASYGVYDVNTPPASENEAYRFKLDFENGKFIIPLSVSRGGMDKGGEVCVNIFVQNDTIAKMVEAETLKYADESGNVREVKVLPEGKYTLPSGVSIPSGEDTGKFTLDVDFDFLESNINELFAIAIHIDSQDREVSKGLNTTVVVIDTKFMEVVSSFTYKQDDANPNRIIFTNTSNGAVSVLWDFGDGATSTEMNPTHVYATKGRKMVTLKSTGILGTGDMKEGKVEIWDKKGVTWFFPNGVRPFQNDGVFVGPFSTLKDWNMNSNVRYITEGSISVGGWGPGDDGIIHMEPSPWPDGVKASNAHIWCTKKLPRGEYYVNFNVGASGIEPNGVSEGSPCFLNLNFIAVKGNTMPDITDIDNNPNVLGGLKFRKTAEETGYKNWYIQEKSWEWDFKFTVEEEMEVSIGFVASFGRASFFRIFNINQFNQLAFD